MAQISIQEVENGDITAQPVIKQLGRRLADVRRRAFELFQLRGGSPGRELQDWFMAEREVLGWPPLETQENDSEFEFQVPLDDLEVRHVEIIVTPSEIIVHVKSDAQLKTEEACALQQGFAAREIYRRIALSQPIRTDRTTATLENGTLRITAAKAGAKRHYGVAMA